MKQSILWILLVGFSMSLPAAQQSKRMNVLFIASDDMRPALNCYGNAIVKSPNIDRLAARGVRFERAYCQSPLCNPSRTSLMTGRYAHTTGVLDNLKYFRDTHPNWVTLPQHFRQNGYVTARTGKIFHGGIDDQTSWVEGGEKGAARLPRPASGAEDYRKQSDRWEALEQEVTTGDYKVATAAVSLLEKYSGQPFFIAVGFSKPHSPLLAPQKYFALYDASRIPLPVDFASRPKSLPGSPEVAITRNGDLFINRDATPVEAREMIRAYYACISFVDAQVGRLLEAVDRLKLWDTTVIVFWGDHGYHLGEKGKWSKHNSLFEVGARVPLIVYAPGQNGNGKSSPRTVDTLDLYPTLAELCGLPEVSDIEGNTLVPLLKNPTSEWRHPAYSETSKGKTVRTEHWRYTEWSGGKDGAELYDQSNDPHELTNLAGKPEHASTVAEMKRLLTSNWRTAIAEHR